MSCSAYLGNRVINAVTVAGDNRFNVQHAAHHGGDQADAAALAQVGQCIHVIEYFGILDFLRKYFRQFIKGFSFF